MEETLRNNIKIVEHYGYEKQIPVWIEEMSELTKELCKWSRQGLSEELKEHIEEEIADVTICLDQLKYILHYTEDDLMEQYKFKVKRQLDRINDEKIDMIKIPKNEKIKLKAELKDGKWL